MKHIHPELTIKKIHHLSDIQIRLLKRHKEYRQVLDRLCTQLLADKDDSLIVISGDIIHTKTELSPELVDMTHDFLLNVSNIAPTIVMLGNHDCNLNNKERMDSLQPIIKGIDSKNLYYFKNSEVFKFGNLNISIMGVYETQKEYAIANKLPDGIKVAIYHGTVNNSVTDLGYEFRGGDMRLEFFSGFDMVLLGDIHKMQRLQTYDKNASLPEVWYAGSLIQQNHGESLSHGFLTWDVETRTPVYNALDNAYGYYTIEIRNGIPSDYSNIPKKPRLRVHVWDTDGSDVKRILADVRKMARVQEVTINRMSGISTGTALGKNTPMLDVQNVNIQNDLIENFLNRTYVLDQEVQSRIKTINTNLNNKLPAREIASNVHWRANKFEFSNMFSFGEDNVIDFTNMSGTVGIFAPNASGKSSILDALSFNIFDKCSRTFRANQILNNRKNNFVCKFSFYINDVLYYIRRTATKRKYTNQIKVDVDFWYINEFGEEVSLNGEERRSTDDVIRSYIGAYDDFILTALSTQHFNAGFIDMGQSDRKDLLSRFLGLNIFEELFQLGSKEIAEVQVMLKDFQRQDFAVQLAKAETDKDANKRGFADHNEKKKTASKQRDILNEKIVSLVRELVPIDESILDIDKLTLTKRKLFLSIQNHKVELEQLKLSSENIRETIEQLETELSVFNEDEITAQYEELMRLEKERNQTAASIETCKVDIKHKLDKLGRLKEHKYDPNCIFCMNNIFVKDALKTEEELKRDKELVRVFVDKIVAAKSSIEKLEHYRVLYDEFASVHSKMETVKMTGLELDVKLSNTNSQLKTAQFELGSVEEKIEKYDSMKDAVEKNKLTNKEIDRLKDVLSQLVDDIDSLDSKLRTTHSKVRVAETAIQSINEAIQHAKELEIEYTAYEYYLNAVKRDGVPFDLISNTVPEIEQEVNNILGQVADFSIVWNLDGKNVNTYIAYDENNFWPLELTSGMEKFISSVAIRVALINTSSLPRPNFIALDEGFGVLDSENVNNMQMFLSYLATQFDFALIISHLDQMKDSVDKVVDITKDADGFSSVNYT
jgi:DNA repair exonuclease SbcCD ATPase subunit